MIKAYIVARWSVYIFIIAPILLFITMSILRNSFGISEDNWYFALIIIYILIIRYLLKEKYSNIDIEILNASKNFESGIGMIYTGHFILFLLFIITKWQPVLSFFALPVLLFVLFSYYSGLSMTYKEIEKYKQTMLKKDNKTE
ncbi:hypothetical protein [Sulfurimonas microaerophilic]|uniref:hypothetical protein n=1 Tax=Sulfurimonas microaerophilic TaxID=3058392 RepID=UPI002714DB11|nr:hypothetical protein [Sulfurimonas sp. hsl 1-7]